MRVLDSFLGHDIVSIDNGPTHPIPIVEFNQHSINKSQGNMFWLLFIFL